MTVSLIITHSKWLKSIDDTTLPAIIHKSDETHYWQEVEDPVKWFDHNNIHPTATDETQELVIDFRTKDTVLPLLIIKGEVIDYNIEQIASAKFLGTFHWYVMEG